MLIHQMLIAYILSLEGVSSPVLRDSDMFCCEVESCIGNSCNLVLLDARRLLSQWMSYCYDVMQQMIHDLKEFDLAHCLRKGGPVL